MDSYAGTVRFVRVLGQTPGQSPAGVLGMLSYSWWLYNLLHTNLSAQAKEIPPLCVRSSFHYSVCVHSSLVTPTGRIYDRKHIIVA